MRWIRERLPTALKNRLRHSVLCVRRRAPYANIFHCCVQKTASSWIRTILKDPRVFRYSGLDVQGPGSMIDGSSLRSQRVAGVFPLRKIISPLYVSYEGYGSFAKPGAHRTFFVMRDPRDITVSWYYSARESHPVAGNPPLQEARRALEGLGLAEGLHYSIDYLAEYGLYDALLPWKAAAEAHPATIKLVRYEDLSGASQIESFETLFLHCGIAMPRRVLVPLLADWSFEKMAHETGKNGLARGHYRKGLRGDWLNHFDQGHRAHFSSITKDLISRLGYS